jgi:hypothetical protein
MGIAGLALALLLVFVIWRFAGVVAADTSGLRNGGRDDDPRVDAALAKYGVRVQKSKRHYINIDVRGYGGGVEFFDFEGVDKAGIPVSGRVEFGLMQPKVTFHRNPRHSVDRTRARLEGQAAEPEPPGPEDLIRMEIVRRLDALQGDREAFLESDTDGDGMVDADEWAATRARIEAEVRAELGDAPEAGRDEGSSW